MTASPVETWAFCGVHPDAPNAARAVQTLAVNAGIGIWLFHVPEPGTSQARKVLTGIVVAGIGGCAIAAMR